MDQKAGLLEYRIKSCYDQLTKAEKRVADYILSHISEIPALSAQEIAANSESGAATVVRFCRSCGFVGLSDLKASLKRRTNSVPRLDDLDIEESDSVPIIKQKVLTYYESLINQLRLQLDEDALSASADAIMSAKRVLVSGYGDSSAMATIMNNNLDLHGFDSIYTNDSMKEATHLLRMGPADVMIAFSYTGRFQATLQNLKIARRKGITTIGVVGTHGSPMEKYLDIVLYTNASAKEDSFSSSSSMVGDFAIIGILTSILASRTPASTEHIAEMQEMMEMHRVKADDTDNT